MASTAIQLKKIDSEVRGLRREIAQVRSLLVVIAGEDDEGEYRPEFVQKVLKAAAGKPTHTYQGPGSLLKNIRSRK